MSPSSKTRVYKRSRRHRRKTKALQTRSIFILHFSWIFLLLSCWIASQRLSNNDLHVARCIANELSQADQGTLSFFHLIGSKATPQQAARVFYSMLALQNDNIVCLEQDEPYSDIMIGSTANTAMYAYCPA